MMKKILILYSTKEGHTKSIAEKIASELKQETELIRVTRKNQKINFLEYSFVILGASIHIGSYQKRFLKFVKKNIQELNYLQTAFFTVCLTVKEEGEQGKAEVKKYIDTFIDYTKLSTVHKSVFAGALLYKEYSFLKRLLMSSIAKKSGGDHDTAKNFIYTDWNDVKKFCIACTTMIKNHQTNN
ncbi:flavodoxin domain-containing protein [Spirochaetota bacterium]